MRSIFGRGSPGPNRADVQILVQLRESGADLAQPRDTVYWLYFRAHDKADKAARDLGQLGFRVTVRSTPKRGRDEWVVRASQTAVVNSATIPRMRAEMEEVARRHGGDYDSWEVGGQVIG
jgi:hypothetical protein